MIVNVEWVRPFEIMTLRLETARVGITVLFYELWKSNFMTAAYGSDCDIHDDAELGIKYVDDAGDTTIGNGATIRSGTKIYCDVRIGDDLTTGHDALVREETTIGDNVVVGTNVVIEGHVTIGDGVKLETNVFVPTHTSIGNNVFIGPGAVLTNDKYPQRQRESYEPQGPVLADNVTIGANATVLPGVEIGEGAMIGAGSTVTDDVPAWHQVVGVPAKTEPLPEFLCEPNHEK